MSLPDQQSVTDGMLELLREGTSKKVGDHELPDEVDDGDPYVILYSIPGGNREGPFLVDPPSDAVFTYQVTSVGKSRKQVEWMANMVRNTVTARDTDGSYQVSWPTLDPIATHTVTQRGYPEGAGSSGVEVEGLAADRVYQVHEVFVVAVSPA